MSLARKYRIVPTSSPWVSEDAKSRCLDPIPSTVSKDFLKVLLPTIRKIVNMSLSTATMVKSLKTAVVSLLKEARC